MQKQIEERKAERNKNEEEVNAWGFKSEETKKLFEARMRK